VVKAHRVEAVPQLEPDQKKWEKREKEHEKRQQSEEMRLGWWPHCRETVGPQDPRSVSWAGNLGDIVGNRP
jgi:hypothetical protein